MIINEKKTFSAEFKAKIVLELLLSEKELNFKYEFASNLMFI